MNTELMNRDDIFKTKQKTKDCYDSLERGTFSIYHEDNEIVKKYVDAKYQGNYRHLIYDCNSPEKTVYKNMLVLKKIISLVNKPLIHLDEEDILTLQNKLNRNEVTKNDSTIPISFAYKRDVVKTFKQFWTFYRAYAKHELQKEVPNISEYFRVRKDKNVNQLIKFLKKEEIDKIAEYSHNIKMRALIKVFFETGARTIEILNLRKYNCSFDETKGRWVIKLPNMKGISTGKMPIEIDYAHKEFDVWMKRNDFAEDDYIFNYTYDYFRIYLAETSKKILGWKVTPKMFRKSCAMHLVNLDINEQYIKSHMGWSASSKAISHYINQKAIKRPDKLKTAYEPDQASEVQQLKIKLPQMEAMLLQKFAEEY